jgi:hypothetical protein
MHFILLRYRVILDLWNDISRRTNYVLILSAIGITALRYGYAIIR